MAEIVTHIIVSGRSIEFRRMLFHVGGQIFEYELDRIAMADVWSVLNGTIKTGKGQYNGDEGSITLKFDREDYSKKVTPEEKITITFRLGGQDEVSAEFMAQEVMAAMDKLPATQEA